MIWLSLILALEIIYASIAKTTKCKTLMAPSIIAIIVTFCAMIQERMFNMGLDLYPSAIQFFKESVPDFYVLSIRMFALVSVILIVRLVILYVSIRSDLKK